MNAPIELRLRPPVIADAPAVFRLLADGRVAPTTSTLPLAYRESHARMWLHSAALSASPTSVERLIELCDGAAVVGAVSCKQVAPRVGNVAYWVGPEHWGRGIASEAVRQLLDELRGLGSFDRLEARHLADNPASGGVLRRNGFVRTGRQEAAWRGGAPRWMETYALTLA